MTESADTSTVQRSRRDPNARSITFRLPLELYNVLQEYADEERRSLNAVTCLLLEEAIASREELIAQEQQELQELRAIAAQVKREKRAAAKAAAQATA